MKSFLSFLTVLMVFYATIGLAMEIEVKESREVAPFARAPHHFFQLTPTHYCFQRMDSGSDRTAMCTLNGGQTFAAVTLPEGFCGPSGVTADGSMICPSGSEATINEFGASLSATLYSLSEDGFSSSASSDNLVVDFTASNFAADDILFGGAVFVESKNEYFRAITLTRGEGEVMPALFRSTDGFLWEFVSKLPFETGENILTFSRGAFLGVSFSQEANAYNVTYYNDVVKKWSSIKEMKATLSPTAVTFPSGLMAELRNQENLTSTDVKLSVSGVPLKKVVSVRELHNSAFPQATIPEDEAAASIAGIIPVTEADQRFLHVYYQVCFEAEREECKLFFLSLAVDDSAEMKLKELRAEEEEKKKEAKRKAAEEARDRKRKLKEEREKKREEKRQEFKQFDEPFLAKAVEQQQKDGEMIVVRQGVRKQFVEFEKEAFFA